MSNKPLQQFRASDENIEAVSRFVLLGSVVEVDSNCAVQLMRRFVLGSLAV